MRKFLRKIEGNHRAKEGNHVDTNGDLRDKYGALVARGSAYYRRRRRGKPAPASSLEGLPVEIKVLILQSADITTLKALVHASSSLHRAYLSQRRTILEKALRGVLPPDLFLDALSLLKALRLPRDVEPRQRSDAVSRFLHDYKVIENQGNYPCENLDIRILIPMAKFQMMIEALALQYCNATLPENPVTGSSSADFRKPTGTELTRVYRALYRFDIYCALFQVKKDWSVGNRELWRRTFSVLVMSRIFLATYGIWEVEEMACIGMYILERFDVYLRAAGNTDPSDGRKESQKQRQRSDTSLNLHLKEKREYCMGLGLEYFYDISTAKKPERQLNFPHPHVSEEESSLARALDKYHENQQQSHRDQGINPEMFHDVKFATEEAGPNSGFLWSKGAKPWDFDQINNGHRDWGYVFWDRSRLKEWGVLRMNRRTWRREPGVQERLLSR